jgi:NitT/TauT family transport system permease protein
VSSTQVIDPVAPLAVVEPLDALPPRAPATLAERTSDLPLLADAARARTVGAIQLSAWLALLPVAATLVALGIHLTLPNRQLDLPTRFYPLILKCTLGLLIALAAAQWALLPLRRWLGPRAPLLAAVILLVCAWDLVTVKLALVSLPYFPGPDMVLQSLVNDWQLLLKSTYHSLTLLLSGYAAGVAAGLVSGVCIGWSPRVRYWYMPLVKVLGPIPATAWIPFALAAFPTTFLGGMAMIALAVWFPVTMLAASGVSNVRASYLDVARTLGASRWFLIFRVAIPAAMPSIFVGLFMGLGASFLTLLVAESTGVSSGLGWYIDWARNYSDYTKVFAALGIMAAFFSTIMTVLFRVRDGVLVWQKGTIKW